MSTKDTGVPRLTGQSNYRQWYVRLKAYMQEKETWEAVRFIPQKQTPATSEPSETGRYADLPDDDDDVIKEEFEYHPKNAAALNQILRHCEDGPANKITGIKSARDAIFVLAKHYSVSNELEKFLIAERLWTTTYESVGDARVYTDRFQDIWKDINRLK